MSVVQHISIDECAVLGKSSIWLDIHCATCAPKLNKTQEYYDNNNANHLSTNSSLVKQNQLKSKLAVVETK